MPKTENNLTVDALDLGNIDAPVLIFGGIYSNLQAAEALRIIAEKKNIPPEQCICTGDIVAYCSQPAETVDFIRKWGVHCLLGNCEESLANNADDCGCGFDNGSQCDVLSNQWFTFANKKLSSEHRQWFSKLPRHIKFTMNKVSALVVHGSVSSINQFIFESTDKDIFTVEFSLAKSDMVIGGHSGIPFTKKVGNTTWHNSGAIGMPANDGTTKTWYSIISPTQNNLLIEQKKLNYNHNTTVEMMKTNHINDNYTDTLTSGLWPSMDVLPTKEKQHYGIEIKECSYMIFT
jgi:predicted phosphodiesterase